MLKPRTRHILFFFVIGLQIVFFIGLVGMREHILETGEVIRLSVIPIDPNHPFMGEYVDLNYNITQLPFSKLLQIPDGETVYVSLMKDGEIYEAFDVDTEIPTDLFEGEVFIKGRKLNNDWIEYGIESFFVPEGTALEIERSIWDYSVTAEIYLDEDGTAQLNRLFIGDDPVEY